MLVHRKGVLYTESSHMDFMSMRLKLKSVNNLKFLYMTTAFGRSLFTWDTHFRYFFTVETSFRIPEGSSTHSHNRLVCVRAVSCHCNNIFINLIYIHLEKI